MAFNFKLQKVLDYRGQLEEQAMQALAQAKQLLEKEKERETQLWEEIHTNKELLADSANLKSGERWLIQNYVIAIEQDIKRSRKLQQQFADEVSRCQKELVIRSQERQLLDKLKDKQNEKHLHEQKMSEQRQYDETATIRHKKTSGQTV